MKLHGEYDYECVGNSQSNSDQLCEIENVIVTLCCEKGYICTSYVSNTDRIIWKL